jgi:hypothetical protein
MLQDSIKRKKLLGAIIATFIFVLWIFVDIYIFPLFGLTSYTLYEVLAYGSWIIIIFICFGILSWAGWFPMTQDESPK